jgi:hypothetical protein
MSDEQMPTSSPDDVPPVTSENVEVPAAAPGHWIMPKPVFRQSSGYLPQGFERQYGRSDGATATATAAAAAVATEGPSVQEVEVLPQPDVTEVVTYATAEPAPPPKTRSRAMRITLIVLGLLAMAAFITIFLAVIYFLFLSHPNESQVLN